MENVRISRNPRAHQFELLHDGQHIGAIDYVQDGDVVTMTHIAVSDEYSGMGLAARLTEAALDDVRANTETVVAQCPYVRGYILKHPRWADLAAGLEVS